MKFDLDEDRALLKTSARELLEKEGSLEATRQVVEETAEGFSPDLYAQLGELGYLGLTLPEERGGSGFGILGLVAVLHEMGRVAFPGPFLDLVLAAETLSRLPGPLPEGVLEDLVGGRSRVVLARSESLDGREPDPPGVRHDHGRVTGRKLFVPYAASADALVVTTDQGLVRVERPGSGWNLVSLDTLDHAQRFCEVTLDQEGTLLADLPQSREILVAVDRIAALGASALLLGLMERALEMTVAYLKERHAFSRPIGSFQALQHRAADMLLETESSRSAVYRAAWALESHPEEAPLLIAAAKAYAGNAAKNVTGEAIQMFGGVGYTWEYDPHIFYKRVKSLEQCYGSTREQWQNALTVSGL